MTLTRDETDLLLESLDHMQTCAGLADVIAGTLSVRPGELTQSRIEEEFAKQRVIAQERSRKRRDQVILLKAKLVQGLVS